MLRKTFQVAGMLIIVGSGVLLSSCTTTPATGAPTQATAAPMAGSVPEPNVQIKVTGTADQWMAFDKALRPLIGAEPLRCFMAPQTGSISDCGILQTGPVPGNTAYVAYEFFGGHTYVYDKFGAAFDQIKPNQPMLTVTRVLPVAPDCGPPTPQPCFPAPYCPYRCEKVVHTCQRCQ